jgi:hypothetical protein
MVFNTTFNNISAKLWQSLSVYWWRSSQRKSSTCRNSLTNHIMLYRVHLAWVWFDLTTLVVIGTACIGSCKSNYHTIKIMTVPAYITYFRRWILHRIYDIHIYFIQFLKYVLYAMHAESTSWNILCMLCLIHFLKYVLYAMLNPVPDSSYVCYTKSTSWNMLCMLC